MSNVLPTWRDILEGIEFAATPEQRSAAWDRAYCDVIDWSTCAVGEKFEQVKGHEIEDRPIIEQIPEVLGALGNMFSDAVTHERLRDAKEILRRIEEFDLK